MPMNTCWNKQLGITVIWHTCNINITCMSNAIHPDYSHLLTLHACALPIYDLIFLAYACFPLFPITVWRYSCCLERKENSRATAQLIPAIARQRMLPWISDSRMTSRGPEITATRLLTSESGVINFRENMHFHQTKKFLANLCFIYIVHIRFRINPTGNLITAALFTLGYVNCQILECSFSLLWHCNRETVIEVK